MGCNFKQTFEFLCEDSSYQHSTSNEQITYSVGNLDMPRKTLIKKKKKFGCNERYTYLPSFVLTHKS